MTMTELLERIRALYVDELCKSLAETSDAVGEPILRQGSGAIGRDGDLDLGMRIDVAVVRDGKGVRQFHVASSRRMQFEPIEVDIQGVQATLHPFAWDGLTLQVFGGSDDLTPFTQWFTEWFGDDTPPGADGLRGVVHFLSDPTPIDDGQSFEVDLGSAPIEAFVTLLHAGVTHGASRIVVGSSP